MAFGLRSVAFVSELIHQPARHDPRALQKLHGDLFGDAHCSYRDFRLVAGGAMLSNTTNMVPGQPNEIPGQLQVWKGYTRHYFP